MSYLKSAGVSKADRTLRAHFIAGEVDPSVVCIRKPDVCVWNFLFTVLILFLTLHNVSPLALFSFTYSLLFLTATVSFPCA